jgi:hypothetical protein
MSTLIKSSKQAAVATDFKFAGSNERLVASNGEVNASNKKDLLMQASRLMMATSQGDVVTEGEASARAQIAATNKQLLAAAFEDPKYHRIVGERIADNIYMTANRKGVARRFLNRVELKQGEIPRFPVRKKNVTAMMLTGPTRVETQLTMDKWLTPPELQIATRVFVPQNEINQSNSDVLEEKYVEALEGIMVTEDRMWINAARQTIGVDNTQSIISGTLSPLTLMSVRQGVAQWGLKPMYCFMANDLFVDVVGDASFIQAIEPVSRHELIMTGELATMYGMTIISEAYRHPEHKVLNQGEFVVVSDPQFHGAYSDRGGVDSQPIDGTTERIMGRGWLLSESVAMTIANSRSVAVGQRI